ncbi:MAG: restriction endonuclease [Chloroflexi bacterium]|nr:restriction endonuclease [Chloroflexota bacterium]
MELTRSYERVVPEDVQARYDWIETRNAAAVLKASNATAFADLIEVLRGFRVIATDIINPGGSQSAIPKRLNREFRERGWREARYDTHLRSVVRVKPYTRGEGPTEREAESKSLGYLVDSVKDRIALDVEWHAKDGNLDRDIGAYRAFYDGAVIDGGVIVTRSYTGIRTLSVELGRAGGFKTTTTTTIEKLTDRLARGDGGGCPILGVAITRATYAP